MSLVKTACREANFMQLRKVFRCAKYLISPYRWAGLLVTCTSPDRKVLLIRRAFNPGKGTWSVPGGKLDNQDGPNNHTRYLNGAVREFAEEMLGAREHDSSEIKAQLFAKAMRWELVDANRRLKSMPFHESGIGWFFRFRTFLLEVEREDTLQLDKVFPNAEIADWGWHRIDKIPVAPYYYLSKSLKSFTRRSLLD